MENKQTFYFDHNVLTNLKAPKTETYITISQKLAEYSDFIEIFYSYAHMLDLHKGYDKSKASTQYTERDLEFISQLTKNLALIHYLKEDCTKIVEIDPREYFQEAIKSGQESINEAFDLDSLFEGTEDNPDLQEKIKKLKELKFETDGPFVPIGDSSAFHGLPTPKAGDGVMQYLNNLANHFDQIRTNPEVYKSIRSLAKEGTGLNSNVSNWNNPIQKLDEYLPKTSLGKSFTQVVMGAGNSLRKAPQTTYEYFLATYTTLDLFGYHQEKINAQNTFTNLRNDAYHAYYASTCDFFISNDDRCRAKTKVLYEKFGITTAIASPAELAEGFKKLKKINKQ